MRRLKADLQVARATSRLRPPSSLPSQHEECYESAWGVGVREWSRVLGHVGGRFLGAKSAALT